MNLHYRVSFRYLKKIGVVDYNKICFFQFVFPISVFNTLKNINLAPIDIKKYINNSLVKTFSPDEFLTCFEEENFFFVLTR